MSHVPPPGQILPGAGRITRAGEQGDTWRTDRAVRRGGRGWAALLVGLLVGALSLAITRRNLAPDAQGLLAAQLRLSPDRVRIGRASLHPLGELRLDDVVLDVSDGTGAGGVDLLRLGGATVRLGRVTVILDPLRALHGQARPRRIVAEEVEATAGLLGPLTAQRATVWVQGPTDEGRTRLLAEGLALGGPLLPSRLAVRAAQLAAELHRGALQRLVVTGVRVGALGPLDLLLRGSADGVVLRGAMAGAQLTAGAAPASSEARLEMDRLRLPLQLGPFVDLSDTRISGQLALRTDGPLGAPLRGPGALSLRGQLALSDLALRHPVLTAGTLPHLALLLDGELQARRDEEALFASTPRLSLSMGELRLSLSGDVALRTTGGHSADVALVLDEIDCAQLLQALPRRLVPRLEGLGVRGQIGGEIRLSYDTRTLPEVDVRPAVDIGCQVVSDPPQADPHALLDPRLSVERPGEDGQPRRLPLGPEAKRAPDAAPFQPLRGLPWPVVRAFLVAEDNQFFHHHGFDVQMIIRALGMDLKDEGPLRGASTITQQLAKNLWLGSERALGRKLEEAVLAWRMEQVVPKERLLEVYLNLVELGSGIYGISMAAQHYFGLPAAKLTLDQAAQLAALLPAPRRGMDAAWGRRYRDILHRYGTAPVPPPPGG